MPVFLVFFYFATNDGFFLYFLPNALSVFTFLLSSFFFAFSSWCRSFFGMLRIHNVCVAFLVVLLTLNTFDSWFVVQLPV